MFDLIRNVFKRHRGASYAIALLHIFTVIPAAMVFWFEKDPNTHLVYYAFVASVSVITSWIFYEITKEVKQTVKYYMIRMEIAFAIIAAIAAPFLLTFYMETAVFFSNFFEQIYSNSYFGPNRLISAAIMFAFYNLFFIRDIVRSFRRKKPVVEEQKTVQNVN